MKNLLMALLLVIIYGQATAQKKDVYHTVVSYNIHYDNPEDINPWLFRKAKVAAGIKDAQAGVAGIQEAQLQQIEDLQSALPRYKWVGNPNEDGRTQGEYCPIFYDTLFFKRLDYGTFWLSDTPEKPSLSWTSKEKKVVTWAQFQSLENDDKFYVFNTQIDQENSTALKSSADLLKQKIQTIAGNTTTIITGDLNGEPGSIAHKKLTKGKKSLRLYDPVLSQKNLPLGDLTTYCGFNASTCVRQRRDYVLTKGAVKVRLYVSIWETLQGLLPSDHLPVIMEFKIEAT